MKITEILETIALAVIISACLILTTTLIQEMEQLKNKVTILESNYQHLLHRLNTIEYPDVLGKEDKKVSKSDG